MSKCNYRIFMDKWHKLEHRPTYRQ